MTSTTRATVSPLRHSLSPGMEILLWPHPSLKQVCQLVIPGEDVSGLIAEMIVTAERARGIGLAANQVGVHKRVLVAKDHHGQWHSFINPEIVEFKGEWKMMREGCLSAPNVFEQTKRNTRVVVRHGFKGETLDTGALLAHVLQHEVEHLDGKMFVKDFKLRGLLAQAALRRGGR